jgi:hypothetical protein
MPATAGCAQGYPVLFGCQATRDPLDLLRELQGIARVIIPIEIPVMHPCPLAAVVQAAEALGLPVSLPAGLALSAVPQEYAIGELTELDPPDNRTHWIECVRHGPGLAQPERPLVICGSVYYLGEILRVFEGHAPSGC